MPGQRSGRCPGLCAKAVGGGLGGRAAPVSDERTHWRWLVHKIRYTMSYLLSYLYLPTVIRCYCAYAYSLNLSFHHGGKLHIYTQYSQKF